MKRAWRDGTAPTRTLDVPDFVERHVHENFAVSMGPKPLPRHKHLEGTKSPLIVRNPPHHVHKSLNLNKSSMGTEGSGATSNHIKIKGRRAVKKDNTLQHHPYAHAAKTAKRQSAPSIGYDDDGDTNEDMSPSLLFTKAGIIGTPEFDAYDKYRLDIFPFKEALKHEVNKLVLQKQKLDRINQQLREERRRQLLEERMRGGSGRRRARHVQQQESEDNDETSTTEGDDNEEDSTDGDENNDDDTGTSTDTEEYDDTNDEEVDEEVNEDDEQQQHKDVDSCMCSDCLKKYTLL